MTALAMSHALSTMSHALATMSPQLNDADAVTDNISSCLTTLVTGLSLCLRRLSEARSSAADLLVTEQLTCCDRLLTEACRRLLSTALTLTRVDSVTSFNEDDINTTFLINLSHLRTQTGVLGLLETALSAAAAADLDDEDDGDDDGDGECDNTVINSR